MESIPGRSGLLLYNRATSAACRVKLNSSVMNVSSKKPRSRLVWPDFRTNVMNTISDMRERENLFDVTVFAQERSFDAHKLILAAGSGLLKKIFTNDPNKSIQVVKLENVEPFYFEVALDFMYKGTIELEENQLSTFLAVAKILQLKGLSGFLPTSSTTPKVERKSQRSIRQSPASSRLSETKIKLQIPEPVPNKRQKLAVTPHQPQIKKQVAKSSQETLEAVQSIMSDIPPSLDEEGNLSQPELSSVDSHDNCETELNTSNPLTSKETEVKMPEEVVDPTPTVEAVPLSAEEQEKADRAKYYESISGQGPEVGPNGLSGYKCKYCQKMVESRYLLRMHFEENHGDTEIPCEMCGKLFRSSRRIKNHQTYGKCKPG
ncbi:transcription factor GAGA-like [Tigriopus californicus]|uniref:transcription factor GAGA-like n=1 Tax=Tigriopus californicus TaxID=6832 RepID=UPI0027DA5583|nr:transcription factor GAGA-like [Tigriopus californicus]